MVGYVLLYLENIKFWVKVELIWFGWHLELLNLYSYFCQSHIRNMTWILSIKLALICDRMIPFSNVNIFISFDVNILGHFKVFSKLSKSFKHFVDRIYFKMLKLRVKNISNVLNCLVKSKLFERSPAQINAALRTCDIFLVVEMDTYALFTKWMATLNYWIRISKDPVTKFANDVFVKLRLFDCL